MALNGTDWMQQPWNTTFAPFTNIFEDVMGNGQVFFLFPLIIVTFGVQIKTQNSVMTTMFMIGSGALLATGSLFTGMTYLATAFTIFAAFGIAGLIMSLLFQR